MFELQHRKCLAGCLVLETTYNDPSRTVNFVDLKALI